MWMGSNLTQDGYKDMVTGILPKVLRKKKKVTPEKVADNWRRLAGVMAKHS